MWLDFDLNRFDWFFVTFKAHPVNIQVLKVSENSLLTTRTHDEFVGFINHAKLEERLILIIFALIKLE